MFRVKLWCSEYLIYCPMFLWGHLLMTEGRNITSYLEGVQGMEAPGGFS